MNVPSTGQLNHTVELLQQLIRNECVNDGTRDSGHERRNADLLQTYLEGGGLEVERFTPHGDRTSIVARIEGSDPRAPKLCFMGHTDVVPANPAGWTRDPFGGELIDGEIWGRGAIDMLGLTASMAVAFKHLAQAKFRPPGDLIYFGVADEEAGGEHGAEWMVKNHWDVVACDYMVTEIGGYWSGDGKSILISTEEKGLAWRRLTVVGTPGHGSMPYGSDNALITAAEVIRRISAYSPTPRLGEVWRRMVETSRLSPELRSKLLDPDQLDEALTMLPVAVAGRFHASSHTTFSCNVVHGGQKTNIVPDRVQLDVDVRTLPGVDNDEVDATLTDVIGADLMSSVSISRLQSGGATASPAETPLWDEIGAHARIQYPGAELVPNLMVIGSDGRFFRERGTTVYGAGLFSKDVDSTVISSRFHGNDERIDIESLGLCADLWTGLAQAFVG